MSHWLKCQVNSVVNNQSIRLDSDSSQKNGSDSTVSAVNATHHTRSDTIHCSTQCCSQPKGDVRDQSEDQECDQKVPRSGSTVWMKFTARINGPDGPIFDSSAVRGARKPAKPDRFASRPQNP
eukprot:2433135-Amphidinium_carterae.1